MSQEFEGIALIPATGMLVPRVVAGLTVGQLNYLSNGCGPASAKVKLIPDSILGIDFKPACMYHDVCYYFGKDEEDKHTADRLFLYNLLVLVDRHYKVKCLTGCMQHIAGRAAAFAYYKAVADWGNEAFWAGKVRPVCP